MACSRSEHVLAPAHVFRYISLYTSRARSVTPRRNVRARMRIFRHAKPAVYTSQRQRRHTWVIVLLFQGAEQSGFSKFCLSNFLVNFFAAIFRTMSGSRKRSASKRTTVVPPAEPIGTHSASAEERDEPDLKRLISEEVQKAVSSALAESVAPLLANLSGISVSPSQLGTCTENTGAAAQFLDHPATTSRSAHALSVPAAALQDRIVRGEFIEFSCLLPNVLGAPKRESIQLQLNSSRTVELGEPEVGGPSPKSRINDLVSWLEAWSRYMFVVVSHAPARFPELMAYKSTILSANSKYFSEAWLAYDREFPGAHEALGCHWPKHVAA